MDSDSESDVDYGASPITGLPEVDSFIADLKNLTVNFFDPRAEERFLELIDSHGKYMCPNDDFYCSQAGLKAAFDCSNDTVSSRVVMDQRGGYLACTSSDFRGLFYHDHDEPTKGYKMVVSEVAACKTCGQDMPVFLIGGRPCGGGGDGRYMGSTNETDDPQVHRLWVLVDTIPGNIMYCSANCHLLDTQMGLSGGRRSNGHLDRCFMLNHRHIVSSVPSLTALCLYQLSLIDVLDDCEEKTIVGISPRDFPCADIVFAIEKYNPVELYKESNPDIKGCPCHPDLKFDHRRPVLQIDPGTVRRRPAPRDGFPIVVVRPSSGMMLEAFSSLPVQTIANVGSALATMIYHLELGPSIMMSCLSILRPWCSHYSGLGSLSKFKNRLKAFCFEVRSKQVPNVFSNLEPGDILVVSAPNCFAWRWIEFTYISSQYALMNAAYIPVIGGQYPHRNQRAARQALNEFIAEYGFERRCSTMAYYKYMMANSDGDRNWVPSVGRFEPLSNCSTVMPCYCYDRITAWSPILIYAIAVEQVVRNPALPTIARTVARLLSVNNYNFRNGVMFLSIFPNKRLGVLSAPCFSHVAWSTRTTTDASRGLEAVVRKIQYIYCGGKLLILPCDFIEVNNKRYKSVCICGRCGPIVDKIRSYQSLVLSVDEVMPPEAADDSKTQGLTGT
jgi:hypothetical protein